MKSPKRIQANRLGLRAERWAAFHLRLRGYRILETRYKTPAGEIDLIARRGGALAVVEVKIRPGRDEALESVGASARRRIEDAARWYLSRHPACADCDIRFDVIAFSTRRLGFLFPLHLDNAWEPRS